MPEITKLVVLPVIGRAILVLLGIGGTALCSAATGKAVVWGPNNPPPMATKPVTENDGRVPVMIGSDATKGSRAIEFIDFETFPDGTPIPDHELITTQFAPVGVSLFSTAAAAGPEIQQFDLTGQSGLNGLAPNPCCKEFIEFTLSVPVATITFLALDIGENGLRAEAFDSGGVLLDFMEVTNPGMGVDEVDLMTLDGGGTDIARVRMAQMQNISSDGYLIDDLSVDVIPVELMKFAVE